MRVVFLMLAVLAVLAAAPPATAGEWRRPVPGRVLTPFSLGANPFAAGQHRGVDLAARPGVRVRAACDGEVRFAGVLPGGRRGVSLVCGRLIATHLDLAAAVVRRGGSVRRGAVVGVAAGPSVHLGARRLGHRHGYVDPLGLLGEDGPPRLGPAPAGRARRGAPRVVPVARRTPGRAPAAQPARVPVPAWAGLALLAAGMPAGALVRARRVRRRRAARPPTVLGARR